MLKQAVDCTNVRVKELIATAPNNSPNTDGMNFYGGHDQSIVDSVRHHSPLPGQHQHNNLPNAEAPLSWAVQVITNGDDCISVVPTGDPATPRCVLHPEQCAGGDLIVHNVTCKGGHGFSIGSVRHGDGVPPRPSVLLWCSAKSC